MNALLAEARDEAQARDLDAVLAFVETLRRGGVALATIAVRAGLPQSRLEAILLTGRAEDEEAQALTRWKAAADRAGAEEERIALTPTLKRIARVFDKARMAQDGGARGIALIHGASGTGKTRAAKWYMQKESEQAGRGWDFPVVLARCTGQERDFSSALQTILLGLMDAGLAESATRYKKAQKVALEYIQAGGIILFDEAHLMPPRAMDALRWFPDHQDIALGFIGNLTAYKTLMDAHMPQITTRAIGMKVMLDKPEKGDIDTLLEAWGLSGRALSDAAYGIGLQEGGLRILAHVVRTARALSASLGIPVDAEIFRLAFTEIMQDD